MIMKNSIYIFLFILMNLYPQQKEKIIFLFNESKDTLIVNKDSEIYSIEKKHTFKFTQEKNKKREMKYDLIKNNILTSYSEFLELNKGKKYPEYFNDYSFYVFVKKKDNIGCFIEIEKVWLVEDKIVD